MKTILLVVIYIGVLVSSLPSIAYGNPGGALTPSGGRMVGTASWYSTEACAFNPDPTCPTASGESLYDLEEKEEMFAAMWDVPFGTTVRVTNQRSGESCEVRIKDRGPSRKLVKEGRIIDLSKLAFQKIAALESGIINVEIEILRA